MAIGREPLAQVQMDWVKAKAADLNVSYAEVIRRAVDKYAASSDQVNDEEVQVAMETYVKRRYGF